MDLPIPLPNTDVINENIEARLKPIRSWEAHLLDYASPKQGAIPSRIRTVGKKKKGSHLPPLSSVLADGVKPAHHSHRSRPLHNLVMGLPTASPAPSPRGGPPAQRSPLKLPKVTTQSQSLQPVAAPTPAGPALPIFMLPNGTLVTLVADDGMAAQGLQARHVDMPPLIPLVASAPPPPRKATAGPPYRRGFPPRARSVAAPRSSPHHFGTAAPVSSRQPLASLTEPLFHAGEEPPAPIRRRPQPLHGRALPPQPPPQKQPPARRDGPQAEAEQCPLAQPLLLVLTLVLLAVALALGVILTIGQPHVPLAQRQPLLLRLLFTLIHSPGTLRAVRPRGREHEPPVPSPLAQTSGHLASPPQLPPPFEQSAAAFPAADAAFPWGSGGLRRSPSPPRPLPQPPPSYSVTEALGPGSMPGSSLKEGASPPQPLAPAAPAPAAPAPAAAPVAPVPPLRVAGSKEGAHPSAPSDLRPAPPPSQPAPPAGPAPLPTVDVAGGLPRGFAAPDRATASTPSPAALMPVPGAVGARVSETAAPPQASPPPVVAQHTPAPPGPSPPSSSAPRALAAAAPAPPPAPSVPKPADASTHPVQAPGPAGGSASSPPAAQQAAQEPPPIPLAATRGPAPPQPDGGPAAPQAPAPPGPSTAAPSALSAAPVVVPAPAPAPAPALAPAPAPAPAVPIPASSDGQATPPRPQPSTPLPAPPTAVLSPRAVAPGTPPGLAIGSSVLLSPPAPPPSPVSPAPQPPLPPPPLAPAGDAQPQQVTSPRLPAAGKAHQSPLPAASCPGGASPDPPTPADRTSRAVSTPRPCPLRPYSPRPYSRPVPPAPSPSGSRPRSATSRQEMRAQERRRGWGPEADGQPPSEGDDEGSVASYHSEAWGGGLLEAGEAGAGAMDVLPILLEAPPPPAHPMVARQQPLAPDQATPALGDDAAAASASVAATRVLRARAALAGVWPPLAAIPDPSPAWAPLRATAQALLTRVTLAAMLARPAPTAAAAPHDAAPPSGTSATGGPARGGGAPSAGRGVLGMPRRAHFAHRHLRVLNRSAMQLEILAGRCPETPRVARPEWRRLWDMEPPQPQPQPPAPPALAPVAHRHRHQRQHRSQRPPQWLSRRHHHRHRHQWQPQRASDPAGQMPSPQRPLDELRAMQQRHMAQLELLKAAQQRHAALLETAALTAHLAAQRRVSHQAALGPPPAAPPPQPRPASPRAHLAAVAPAAPRASPHPQGSSPGSISPAHTLEIPPAARSACAASPPPSARPPDSPAWVPTPTGPSPPLTSPSHKPPAVVQAAAVAPPPPPSPATATAAVIAGPQLVIPIPAQAPAPGALAHSASAPITPSTNPSPPPAPAPPDEETPHRHGPQPAPPVQGPGRVPGDGVGRGRPRPARHEGDEAEAPLTLTGPDPGPAVLPRPRHGPGLHISPPDPPGGPQLPATPPAPSSASLLLGPLRSPHLPVAASPPPQFLAAPSPLAPMPPSPRLVTASPRRVRPHSAPRTLPTPAPSTPCASPTIPPALLGARSPRCFSPPTAATAAVPRLAATHLPQITIPPGAEYFSFAGPRILAPTAAAPSAVEPPSPRPWMPYSPGRPSPALPTLPPAAPALLPLAAAHGGGGGGPLPPAGKHQPTPPCTPPPAGPRPSPRRTAHSLGPGAGAGPLVAAECLGIALPPEAPPPRLTPGRMAGRSGYDRYIAIFSPEGKLFQIEYACKAIRTEAVTAVAVRGRDCVVIACEKKVPDKLIDPDTVKHVYRVTEHIGGLFVGIQADARQLLHRVRIMAANFKLEHGIEIPCDYLAKMVADDFQFFTQHAYSRPLGVSLMLFSIDEEFGPQLFKMDPSGFFAGYKAAATGQKEVECTNQLEKKLRPNPAQPELHYGECLKAVRAIAPLADREVDAALTEIVEGGGFEDYMRQLAERGEEEPADR
ncbi:putative Proteasome subunit alpha type-6-B [Paratrimastix pyriformis]|uniref:Proteasome subunit alpha type-6-B n=1 Tax=Paratrimastix pyriformis TaxID=342808 RepID=A0ABQ8UIP3_9EUKA|nr:putative Proteasome subunit alpha type-6-B [Paratrimastix pyriformis]